MSVLKLSPNDNVVLATTELKKGETITADGKKIVLLNDIPNAHKIAIKDFAEGEEVIKYDNVIGYAKTAIKPGEWVHTHNLRTGLGAEKEYTYHFNPISIFPGESDQTFMGYERADGGAGIRNYVAVISTVFCANGPLKDIVKAAEEKYKENDHFDGFLPLTQEFGCSQAGKDLETQTKVIAGVIRNANFGGVLMVSLGCEMMIPTELEKYLGDYDKSRIKYVTIQQELDEVGAGMQKIDEIMEQIDKDRRTPINVGRLHIAMNCGGSDVLPRTRCSGISAIRWYVKARP